MKRLALLFAPPVRLRAGGTRRRCARSGRRGGAGLLRRAAGFDEGRQDARRPGPLRQAAAGGRAGLRCRYDGQIRRRPRLGDDGAGRPEGADRGLHPHDRGAICGQFRELQRREIRRRSERAGARHRSLRLEQARHRGPEHRLHLPPAFILGGSWKIIDVLLEGSISQLSVYTAPTIPPRSRPAAPPRWSGRSTTSPTRR